MAIETALSYPDISAQGFAHPADRAAAAALHSVPMLDKVIKKLNEVGYERKFRQLMLGNAVRLGEDQLPEVWALQRRCANTFDIAIVPASVRDPGAGRQRAHHRSERADDAGLVRAGGVVRQRRAARGPRPRDGPCAGGPCRLHDVVPAREAHHAAGAAAAPRSPACR